MKSVQDMIAKGKLRATDAKILKIAKGSEVPYVAINPQKLSIEVAESVMAEVVVSYTEPNEAELNICLAKGAQLSLVQIFTEEAFVECKVDQAERSSCNMSLIELSSANVACTVNLNGPFAENELNGLFMVSGVDHSMIDLRVNHLSADCTSRSIVKGVAGGRAIGEFDGLVYVAPDAQRTDAQQTSRNIELSDTAHIVTKPQLEIYADDVKCSHGATVGQPDSDAIYYMRQRGLSEEQARRLQVQGFVTDIAERCPVKSVTQMLGEEIIKKLETL